jgi:hypothetical protein
MNRPLLGCVLTALLLVLALPVMAEDAPQAETLGDAFYKGTPLLSFLYRYEEVDQEGFDKNAHASTLRTTVGFKSLPYKGASFLIEAQDVTVLGNAQAYDNKGFEHLNNGVTDRPVVADPAQTTINQAYFQWKNSANKAQVGREEIIIGDARFVGNVGWRQNHQNFDAFTFTNSSLDILDISYRYLNRVQTIVGSSKGMASHLVNADLKFGKIGTLALYGYLLDFTRMENYGGSTSTLGGEFKGKLELGEDLGLLYELEYAMQTDYADNPNTNLEAQYYFLMAGIALKPITFKVGYEVLGGDKVEDPDDPLEINEGQFNTVLATAHKFNGWADKFLATPEAGLEDLFFKANGKFGSLKWLLAYHLFDANDGGSKYGNEFDALITYKASWKQTFGAKAAFYSADDFATDTNKVWVWTGFKI